MRSMTGEGGAATSVLEGLRALNRPHPPRFAAHLLPPAREKDEPRYFRRFSETTR